MKEKENTFSTDGHPADCLYHLTDETGNTYYNYIIICGEPWAHKDVRKHNAALYTFGEMLTAKSYFAKRRVKTYEQRVDKPGYKKRTNDKPAEIS